MSDTKELRPCPFCGEVPSNNFGENKTSLFDVWCETCGYSMAFVWDRQSDPFEEWNVRPIEDTLRADLAAANERAEQAEAAIRAVLADPWGCPFCDCGILRNPIKEHTDTCAWFLLQQAVAEGGEG